MSEFDYDVFLSHNSADKPVVRTIAERLRDAGLRVWFDEWSIQAGDDIYLAVERGLESSRTLVLCMSEAAFGSDWVDLERSTSLFRDPGNRQRRFLPLLIQACRIPDTLRRLKYIDAQAGFDTVSDQLLDSCQAVSEQYDVPSAQGLPGSSDSEPPDESSLDQPASALPVGGSLTLDPSQPPTVVDDALQRIFSLGHAGIVYGVAISPDGKTAVTGGEDRVVRVWDLEQGNCSATLEGHTDYVRSVAISHDGTRAISGADDSTVRVWDLEQGNCSATLEGHSGVVRTVAISHDGSRAISGADDHTVRVWDLEQGHCSATLEGHSDYVRSVALSHDGSRAISGAHDHTVRVWDLEQGNCSATLEGHSGYVWSVAISHDGSRAISGAHDHTVRVWDLEQGHCSATLEGHSGYVWSVAISHDGSRAISGAHDHTVRVWDLEQGHCSATLEGHSGYVWSVAISHDGSRAISGAGDNTVRVWDLEQGHCSATLEGHSGNVLSVAISHDGSRAISGANDNTVRVWDLEQGHCSATLEGHSGYVRSVAISHDGSRAISGANDNTVRVWDLEQGHCSATLEGHSGYVRSVAISHDGSRAISGANDNTVRVWDLEQGHCSATLEGHSGYVRSVAISHDGTRAYSAAWNAVLRVWSLDADAGQTTATHQRRYTNAKIVLLGNSGVGKSGLAHRLIEDRFVETQSTHGMQIWRLDLSLEPDDTLEREALLWDLAGQEDYRLIHQLWLDETSVALVLIDPQHKDPFSEAGDWVKALHAAVSSHHAPRDEAASQPVPVPESTDEPGSTSDRLISRSEMATLRKLLIIARVDRGTLKISQTKVDRFLAEHDFVTSLETSAATGQNCSDESADEPVSELKRLISDSIPWDRLTKITTPQLWADLKNAVLELHGDRTGWLFRFGELVQRLQFTLTDYDFTPHDVRQAVRLLGNQGLTLVLQFGGLALLRPELLNGYASAVIRAARQHIDEIGCVTEADVYADNFNWEGVDRLDRPDEELLLRAMVQTLLDRSLCIAEDSPQGRQLIFPSQYRRERPIPRYPQVFVSYTFTGEPQTIYTTLVVRLWYSHEFENRELWKNAAEFSTSKDHTVGFVMEEHGDGEATLSVFFEAEVPDELRVVLVEYVHRHLHGYAQDVRRDRRYVCGNLQCSEPVTDYEAVRKRLAAGKEFIYCQHCDEQVPLIDHIELRLKSDPVARKVLEMDTRAGLELSNQALEQILIGHLMAICGEANQIFRPVTMADHGIDGEIEFRDADGYPSGKKIYVQLKSGDSHLRLRKRDHQVIFDIRKERHIEYWQNQPVDVWLVIRDSSETIRWMNVTQYLQERGDKTSRQIVFDGAQLNAEAVWRVRDDYFPRR